MAVKGLRISVLGPVQCSVDGAVVLPGGARRGALLALLALRSPHSVGRSELVDGLWGENSPETAVNSIQVHVSALRKLLGADAIQTVGGGYRLTHAASVDAVEFGHAVTLGQQQLARGETDAGAATLRAALGLWRGPALADLDGAPFAAVDSVRLEELRIAAVSSRIEADLALGRHDDVVPELQVLVAQHPLREGLREMLMRALYWGDRQAEALAVYDSGRRVLRDEVGAEPAPALRALHQRLLTQAEAPSPTTQGRPRRQMPGLLDETVGRDGDLKALEGLLFDGLTRLVTVLGPGGVGKTRLGVELGNRVALRFRDGAAFVPLVEAKAAAEVAAIICSALGLRAGDDAAETLVAALQARQMLLICDNFEHVTDAATLLAALLAAAPGLRVLTTSRQPLGLRGEQLYRLEPLPTPGAGGDISAAAELFTTRARSRDLGFTPDAAGQAHIEEICRRCDGLPLAIELAAAHIRVLSLAELHERLSGPLLQLGSDTVDLPERHRTLRANLAWSVDGLPAAAQRLLAPLTVFRGGVTLAAAAEVAGLDQENALRQVETLLDQSLLQRCSGNRGGHRFDMLETVRQYATELLTDEDATQVQRRHAQFFRAVLRSEPEPSPTPPTTAAWNVLVPEQANLRVAIQWALHSPDGELAADLVVGATGLWDALGPRDEMARWTDMLLARADIPPGRRADALVGRAWLSIYKGAMREVAAALAEGQQICEALGDTRRLAWVIGLTAWTAATHGDKDEARRLAERAARLAQRHPQALVLQYGMLNNLGATAREADALERHETTLRFCREHQLDLHALTEIFNVCEAALDVGHVERAHELADEGMATASALGMHDAFAHHVSQRGTARLLLGHTADARADLYAALVGHLEHGSLTYALKDVERIAAVEAGDQPARAAELLGVLDAAKDITDFSTQGLVRDRYLDRYRADLPSRLGSANNTSHSRGRQLVTDLGLAATLALVTETSCE